MCAGVCLCTVCMSCRCWSLCFPLEQERITPCILFLRPSLCLSLWPPESYSCHSVTFPIHNWGVRAAQSPWNHVNHFQFLPLNNHAELAVRAGSACAAALITGLYSSSSSSPLFLASPSNAPLVQLTLGWSVIITDCMKHGGALNLHSINGQQGVTPMVSKGSLVLCKLVRTWLSKHFPNLWSSVKVSSLLDIHFVSNAPV